MADGRVLAPKDPRLEALAAALGDDAAAEQCRQQSMVKGILGKKRLCG